METNNDKKGAHPTADQQVAGSVEAERAAQYKKQRDDLLAFMQSAPVSSGVCCCGDDMQRHGNPMDCGHSPVDEWDYSVQCWAEQIAKADAALDSRAQPVAAGELPPLPKPIQKGWIYTAEQMRAYGQQCADSLTAAGIHYPGCWDTAAYPTVQDAIRAIGAFKCSECADSRPAGGVTDYDLKGGLDVDEVIDNLGIRAEVEADAHTAWDGMLAAAPAAPTGKEG
jgi:hypothetical protein